MDPLLVSVQLALGALGILGVTAAAPQLGLEHAGRLLLGLGITAVVGLVRPRAILRVSPFAYVLGLALLALVLAIGVSPEGSEARRWLLVGGFSLQPSELMKVVVIAYLTAFFHNHLGDWHIWRPMVVIGVAVGLIVLEPDVSTAAFVFALSLGIMMAAGISAARLAAIMTSAGLVALLMVGSLASQFGYIGQRLTGFADLWGAQEQISSTSYQAYRAQQAVVQAGLLGIGPGRPVRVPEAHTDMVAIAVAQSLGLVGIAGLIALFVVLAGRGMRIAALLTGPGSLLAAGATIYLCGQAALNLLVASGLFPVTGIPLPFVSYGLNSLVSTSIAMGFLHAAHREARREGALA